MKISIRVSQNDFAVCMQATEAQKCANFAEYMKEAEAYFDASFYEDYGWPIDVMECYGIPERAAIEVSPAEASFTWELTEEERSVLVGAYCKRKHLNAFWQ